MHNDIQLQNSKQEHCVRCDGIFFEERIMIRRISKLLSGAPADQLIPMSVIVCADCYTPIEDTIPKIVTPTIADVPTIPSNIIKI